MKNTLEENPIAKRLLALTGRPLSWVRRNAKAYPPEQTLDIAERLGRDFEQWRLGLPDGPGGYGDVSLDPLQGMTWSIRTTKETEPLSSEQRGAIGAAAALLLVHDKKSVGELGKRQGAQAREWVRREEQYAVEWLERQRQSTRARAKRNPDIDTIIARLARASGSAKDLWPSLETALHNAAFDPKFIPKLGAFEYRTRDGRRRTITLKTFANRLSRKRKESR